MSAAAEDLLSVAGLRVELPLAAGPLHAVRGIDFSLARGETLCIVGESGCGKSLTSLALMNLLPARAKRSATTLRFAGHDLLSLRERDMAKLRGARIAMIFQEPMTSLNPAYTIGNQLIEMQRQHQNVSVGAARERAEYLLEKVGIGSAGGRLDQYPHQLSGGLRQRVMIAMSLMCGPELIIADEPTTALDVTIQAQILHLLAELQREFRMGLILITHDLGIVARVAAKVAVMYAGEFVETGSVRQVFNDPLHPYTQGLLNCIPVPGKTRPGEPLGSIPGLVPSLIGSQRGCSFRGRCGYAEPRCAADVALTETEPGRGWRCVLSAETLRERAASGAGA